jgi:hypothetical protein
MTDDQLRIALADLADIDRAGGLRDLAEQMELLRRDWCDRRHAQTIGDDLRRDVLASDLAHLLDIDVDRVRSVARSQLDWSQTAIRLLARMADDCRRGRRGR